MAARGVEGVPIPPAGHPHNLPGHLEPRVRESIWQLIAQGLLVPGMNADNADWPRLALTPVGEAAIDEPDFNAYETGSYIANLRARRPLDDTEERYVGQALSAFQHRLYDASAVMLGAASEHLVEELSSTLAALDTGTPSAMRNSTTRKVSDVIHSLRTYLGQRQHKINTDVAENLDVLFSGVSGIIRVGRNDAGHPAARRAATRDEARTYLSLYPFYRRWICDIIDSASSIAGPI